MDEARRKAAADLYAGRIWEVVQDAAEGGREERQAVIDALAAMLAAAHLGDRLEPYDEARALGLAEALKGTLEREAGRCHTRG